MTSIQCETCKGTHKPTISYNICKDGFICDRCGYGQNTYDIIYRLSDNNNSENKCEEIDICCNCAINIANSKDEDNDISTILDHTQHNHNKKRTNARTNVPMINTRFIHQRRKPKDNTTFKPCINYSFEQQPPSPPIHNKDNNQPFVQHNKEQQQHNPAHTTTIIRNDKEPLALMTFSNDITINLIPLHEPIIPQETIHMDILTNTQIEKDKQDNLIKNHPTTTIAQTIIVPQHTDGLALGV